MPTLQQLEYAIAVDTYRHFGKAAEACFVTQPTLSMQLLKLEEELNITLFDRSKKPILPTPAGEKLIKQARVAVFEFKKLEFLSQQSKNEVSGHFRLAVIPTLSPYLIPLFLNSFALKYPNVELEIEELQTDEIIKKLDQDELDAALMATPLQIPLLQEEIICYEPFFLYVHKSHPLAKRAKIKEGDLDSTKLWLLSEGHCLREQTLKLCARQKKGVLENVKFESGNLETLKRLVEQNIGSTLLPYLALLNEKPLSADAVIVEFTKPIPSREISLVYRRTHLKESIVNAMYDTIQKALPDEIRKLRRKHLDVIDI